MIKNTTSGTNENVNTLSQLSDLIVNVNSTVNSDYLEVMFIVLKLYKLVCYLDCQLTCWSQDDCLQLSCPKNLLSSQVLNQWQSKSKCLT